MEEVGFPLSPLHSAQVSWSLSVTPRSRSTPSIWRARTTTKTDRQEFQKGSCFEILLYRCLPCRWPTTTDRESSPGAWWPFLLIVHPYLHHRYNLRKFTELPFQVLEENSFLSVVTSFLYHSLWGVSATRTSTTMFSSTTRYCSRCWSLTARFLSVALQQDVRPPTSWGDFFYLSTQANFEFMNWLARNKSSVGSRRLWRCDQKHPLGCLQVWWGPHPEGKRPGWTICTITYLCSSRKWIQQQYTRLSVPWCSWQQTCFVPYSETPVNAFLINFSMV